MAWCRHPTSHYLTKVRCLTPRGDMRGHCVKSVDKSPLRQGDTEQIWCRQHHWFDSHPLLAHFGMVTGKSQLCLWSGPSRLQGIPNLFVMWRSHQRYTPHIYSYDCKIWCIIEHSWWPSDAIWRQGSRSTLVQEMPFCLTAPSHYLNQCWLVITKVQWCSSEGNFAWDITAISH